MIRLLAYGAAAGLSLWFWAWVIGSTMALVQTGLWSDMPPARYQGIATATVSYMERPLLLEWCRPTQRAAACYVTGLNMVVMPVECSPTRRPMAQVETVNVAYLVRNDFSVCGSKKAHEFGHVNGWPGNHPR